MHGVKAYLRKNPARVYAFFFAIAAFFARLYPEVPIEAVVVVLLAFLGVGNKVQKIEDAKTLKALYTTPPEEE
jgi:hypothetical protein